MSVALDGIFGSARRLNAFRNDVAAQQATDQRAQRLVACLSPARVDGMRQRLRRARDLLQGDDCFQQAFVLLYPNEASRSEEHTSELQSLMRTSYAVFCLKKKIETPQQQDN